MAVKKQNNAIWILLDNQSNQLGVITSATALAKQMKCRLRGLLIEDDALLRAVEFPFAQEISLWTAKKRPITRETLLRTLHAYTQHIKKQLEKNS